MLELSSTVGSTGASCSTVSSLIVFLVSLLVLRAPRSVRPLTSVLTRPLSCRRSAWRLTSARCTASYPCFGPDCRLARFFETGCSALRPLLHRRSRRHCPRRIDQPCPCGRVAPRAALAASDCPAWACSRMTRNCCSHRPQIAREPVDDITPSGKKTPEKMKTQRQDVEHDALHAGTAWTGLGLGGEVLRDDLQLREELRGDHQDDHR